MNDDERQIFALLRECCKNLGLDVTLRVAGGWVRDKLLGLDCQDCDIAIDKMMGQQFAERLRAYLVAQNVPTSAFGVIRANPDRSKHLETATLTIYGYPIDFVNLRAESYSINSRIPEEVKFGGPLEDALRRDITINALFYNIHTEEVEDFCGIGFSDLQSRIIRTPLKPKETLLDDPLRLLRVVRFAARFQFSIEEELRRAIADEEVDGAFRNKISRERVGIELDKILQDTHSLEGMFLLWELRVFNVIFDIPEAYRSEEFKLPDLDFVEKILSTFRYLDKNSQLNAVERRLSLLSHCLLPHAETIVTKGLKRPEPLVGLIVRDSLKFTNTDVNDVVSLMESLIEASDLILHGITNCLATGHLIRKLGKRIWKVALHVAATFCHIQGQVSLIDGLARYCAIVEEIRQARLDEAPTWRGVLSGAEIQKVLGIGEGRIVGKVLTALVEWQIMDPDLSKEEAIERIKTIKWSP